MEKVYSNTLSMPESSFALIRDLIHERTGVFYQNGRSEMLADKLTPMIVERGFDSALDYYYLLKYDPDAGEEWKRVMDALSVPETYFYREMDQVTALVEVIVPDHFSRSGVRPLRVWSAACATGEEPLSIAMALNEAGWLERAPIEIYASDASRTQVQRARRGLYRERAFRTLSADLKAKYFTEEGTAWRVAPEILARVQYRTANLMERSEAASLALADVIFCRNVFIYFSEMAIRKTVEMFYEQMPAPGYLLTAASESLLKLTNDFQLEELGGAFVYVKR